MGFRIPFDEDVADSVQTNGEPPMTRRLAEATSESVPAPSLGRDGMVEAIDSDSRTPSSDWQRCPLHLQNDHKSCSASLCTQDSYPKPVPPRTVSLHDDLSGQELIHPIPHKPYQDNHHVLTSSEPEIDMLEAIHRLRRQRRSEGSQQAHNDNREPPPEYISPVEDEVNGPIPEVPEPLSYHRFYWNCMELKSELIRLDFSLRTIGSSGPGIQAARSVKVALMKLRDLYGANTSFLFPGDLNAKAYNPNESDLFLGFFSIAFNDFGDALDELAKALFEFNNVYHDEKLMLQLFSLHHRFKEEAKTIRLDNHTIPCELSEDIQVLLEAWVDMAITSLKDAIKGFHEKGVPSINYAQNNTTSGYFTLATIAFFLSGTTASMLQVAANEKSDAFGVSANSFLFSSLVFSIASAVNSLLAMGWHKSVVRVPDGSLPLWLKTWMRAGPMVSLLISGAFFVASLCLYVFASSQHTVTSGITVAFSGIHTSGLLFLSGYFIMERWRFRQSAGAVGRELTKDCTILALIEWAKNQLRLLKWTRVPKGNFGSGYAEMDVGSREKCLAWQQPGTDINELEATQRGSPVIWHALSDEKFILNSMFITAQQPTQCARRVAHRSPRGIRGRARDSFYDRDCYPCASAPPPLLPACLPSVPPRAPSVIFCPSEMLGSFIVPREIPTTTDGPPRLSSSRQELRRMRSCPPFTAGSAGELGHTTESPTLDEGTRILRRSQSQPPSGLKDRVDDIPYAPIAEPISTRSEAVNLWRRWREERSFLFKGAEKLDVTSAVPDDFISKPKRDNNARGWYQWHQSGIRSRSPSTPIVPGSANYRYMPPVYGTAEMARPEIEGRQPHRRTSSASGEPPRWELRECLPEGVESRYDDESEHHAMTPDTQSALLQRTIDDGTREKEVERAYPVPPLVPPATVESAAFGSASSSKSRSFSPSWSSHGYHGNVVHGSPRQSMPTLVSVPSPISPFIPPRPPSPYIPRYHSPERLHDGWYRDRSFSPALRPFAAPRIRSPSRTPTSRSPSSTPRIRSPSLSPPIPAISGPDEPRRPSPITTRNRSAMRRTAFANVGPTRMPVMPAPTPLPLYPNPTLPQPGTVQAAAMFLPTPSTLFQRRPRAYRREGRTR